MTAKEFLNKYNELSLLDNYLDYIDIITKEFNLGLSSKSSIPMVVSYLAKPNINNIKPYNKALLIDAGGTNFRCAKGYFNENKEVVLENVTKSKMPGTQGRLEKDDFYLQMATNCKDLLDDTNDVGFCFSYPVLMNETIDGICLPLTKEVDCPSVEGTLVGKETLDKIKLFNNKERKVKILNDTVATLLGGMAKYQTGYSSYVGYIYGTGTNLCYFEDTKNIKKVNVSFLDNVIINTEFAQFDKYPVGDIDYIVVDNSLTGRDNLVEKISSGRYLADVIAEVIKTALKDNLISNNTKLDKFTLVDVSNFMDNKESVLNNILVNDEDKVFIKECIDLLIERAAIMGALGCGTAAIKSGNKELPVGIVCEGTTFYHLPKFKEYFETYLSKVTESRGIKSVVLNGTDLNLHGSLLATLER